MCKEIINRAQCMCTCAGSLGSLSSLSLSVEILWWDGETSEMTLQGPYGWVPTMKVRGGEGSWWGLGTCKKPTRFILMVRICNGWDTDIPSRISNEIGWCWYWWCCGVSSWHPALTHHKIVLAFSPEVGSRPKLWKMGWDRLVSKWSTTCLHF